MSPLVMLIHIVDAGCPKVSPAESMPVIIGNLLWLYSFEKVCNEWPKINLFLSGFHCTPWNLHPIYSDNMVWSLVLNCRLKELTQI